MGYARRLTSKDATWARAWTADALADLVTINAVGGPRHGDVAYVTAEGKYYWWQDDGTWVTISAPTTDASLLTSGTLANARLSSDVPLDNVAEVISGLWDFTNGFKEKARSSKAGGWNDVAYAAGNFTGSGGMGWTVGAADQSDYGWCWIVGELALVTFNISDTDVVAPAGISLQIALPAGLTPSKTMVFPMLLWDAGVKAMGQAIVVAAGTNILCRKLDNSAWTVTAGANTLVQGFVLVRTAP